MTTMSTPVVFTTKSPYTFPSQKFMIPLDWKRYQLSQLINKALSLIKPIPFDFLVHGEILRTSLREWRDGKGVGEEDTLEIEYFESVLPPQRMTSLPHEDWVSSISCRIPQHFLTASYDGHVRLFDYSQRMVRDVPVHQAPITSVCVVPSPSDVDAGTEKTITVGSASHDLTASLTRISLSTDSESDTPPAYTYATLHLHTSPLSSISSDSTGSFLLTASWDHLIGFWDTNVPAEDEVAPVISTDRKKRRKLDAGEGPRRKAPSTVLKSHTARVSKAVFAHGSTSKAYSCGFDSTVRTWDVESGVCLDTITVPERPMLDLALLDTYTLLTTSTDRTVSIFDLRGPSLSSTAGTLMHPATPSCLVCPSPSSPSSTSASTSPTPTSGGQQVLTGAYDGIARLWDLRSTKSPIASVRAWDASAGTNASKILALDWVGDVVGIGGESGVEVWRIGQGERVFNK